MSVVRILTASLVAAIAFSTSAAAGPLRPTSWRLTGAWNVKKDGGGQFANTTSPFARLFDRPADVTSFGARPVDPPVSVPAPPTPTPAPAPVFTPPPPPPPQAQPPITNFTLVQPRTGTSGGSDSSYDALVNFGTGPYRGSDILTSGGAAPWQYSGVIRRFNDGNVLNEDQQRQFISDVTSRVAAAYDRAGLDVNITTDPTASASHSISVVSNTQFGDSPQAVGIAALGNFGFTFLDKFSPVQTFDQLKTAVAHNIAHEMMHTFGVDHKDKTGKFLDAAVTSWDVMVDPNAQFSQEAISELKTRDFNSVGYSRASEVEEIVLSDQIACEHGCEHGYCMMCGQTIAGSLVNEFGVRGSILMTPVPEPASVLTWAAVILGISSLARRRKS